MNGASTIGNNYTTQDEHRKQLATIEKWRGKRNRRSTLFVGASILFAASLLPFLDEKEGIPSKPILIVVGICFAFFLFCLFFLRHANRKVKKLEAEYY